MQVLSRGNVDHAGNVLVVGCTGIDIEEHVLGSVDSEDVVVVGAIVKDMALASERCARIGGDGTKEIAVWCDMPQRASSEQSVRC